MNQENSSGGELVAVQPVDRSALELIEKAEIDVQISTAHAFPRSLAQFTEKAKAMVSVDAETAESCIYRRPVGKENGRVIYAEGESIRLAEIVAATYGNLRVSGMITEMTPKFVKAVGMAHDLESNYAAKAEVMESTVNKRGVPYSERQRIVVSKAAQSKAIRDAIFRVVPKSLCKSLVGIAHQVISGSERPLTQRRQAVMAWMGKLSIDDARVYAALGVGGPEDMTEKELTLLTGLRTAITDGDCSLDEAFPPLESEEFSKGVKGLKDKLSKQKDRKDAEAQKEPESDNKEEGSE